MATLAEIAAAGRCQRGDGQPRPQRQARGQRRRPHIRRSPLSTCSATSDRASCASAAPGLVGLVVPELENPIFPAFAQVIEDGLARRRLHARCSAPSPRAASPRTSTSSPCSTTASPASSSSPAGTPTRGADHDRYRTLIERGHAGRVRQRVRRRAGAPFLSTDDREAMSSRSSHLVQLGHTHDRPRHRPGRFVPGPASARASSPPSARQLGLLREAEAAAGSPRASSPSRAAPPPLARSRPGRHGDRVRLRPDGAGRDPRRARDAGLTCPATCR